MLLKNSIFYIFISSLLAFVCLNLNAEEKVLYKKIDKNGRVIFTDKPVPGSKKVVVNTNKNVMSIPKLSSRSSGENDMIESNKKGKDKTNNKDQLTYSVLAIEKPANDEAVRANDGSLYVIVALSPMLARKHSVRLLMDGAATGTDQKVPYFSLTNINRGTHQLSAQIIDDETGEILQTSQPIEFHLLRTSRLQNNRR